MLYYAELRQVFFFGLRQQTKVSPIINQAGFIIYIGSW